MCTHIWLFTVTVISESNMTNKTEKLGMSRTGLKDQDFMLGLEQLPEKEWDQLQTYLKNNIQAVTNSKEQ